MIKNPIKVALVEDNLDLCADISFQLSANQIDVTVAHNATELNEQLNNSLFHVAIIDIGLSGEDGLSITKRLSESMPDLGLIILTAQSKIDTRLKGYDYGADIYLVKPVDLRVLLAQIRALYRRITISENKNRSHKKGWVLASSCRDLISPNGKSVELTHMESVIMKKLAEEYGRTVKRDQIINQLSGKSSDALHYFDPHRLEVCISRLRQKILDINPEPTEGNQLSQPLKTVRGVGYSFTDLIEIQ